MATSLAAATVFAAQCRVDQREMNSLNAFFEQRQQACRELAWRWEASDQEDQYKGGSSAGTNATVGPIHGYVLDVTEDEDGHAQGECHALKASYRDLISQQ
jgi:hypothetical protein